MKKALFPILLLISAICFSQTKIKGKYVVDLVSVDSPKGTIGILDSVHSSYEDESIKVVWSYGITRLDFTLKNKTEETLKLNWDDAAFIAMNNETIKVFHKGVKYIDRSNSQSPTSIYKGSILSDLVAPTTYTFYSSLLSNWTSTPLIGLNMRLATSEKAPYDENVAGKTIKVVLPLKMGDNMLEYIFTFKVSFIERNK